MLGTRETRVQSLDWEDTLEEGIATHSSILAWEIPWTEEPGRVQSCTEFDATESNLAQHTHPYSEALKPTGSLSGKSKDTTF